MKAVFLKSAKLVEDCPQSKLAEVAIVGHSNAGKSTLINAMANSKNLARVSQKPGKTDILNFYQFEEKFILCDMPGYGYAARGHGARDEWAPMIENYLKDRESLVGVILVLDIQRKWSQDESNLAIWLRQNSLPFILVLNKVDKLNQKERAAAEKRFKYITGAAEILMISAQNKSGVDNLFTSVFDKLLGS